MLRPSNREVSVEVVKKKKHRTFDLELLQGRTSSAPHEESDIDKFLDLVKKNKANKLIEENQKALAAKQSKENEPAIQETQNSDKTQDVASKSIVKPSYKEVNSEEEAGKFKGKLGVKHSANKVDFEQKRESKRIVIQNIDFDEQRERDRRSIASIKRAREKAKSFGKAEEKLTREVILPELITVAELASRMSEKAANVIRSFMKLGMMVTVNQTIDADTAEVVIHELGHKVKRVTEDNVESIFIPDKALDAETLEARPPVVTIVGHVDHGKTSLLDALRETDVVSTESGGITQHIGAYQIKTKAGAYITFIDTPGHEAFTAMRSRGVNITDIVVLVVAADDGVKEQTVEAISHAKAAKVPIIVAINKIDKEGANPNRVVTELLTHGLVTESMGGDIMVVEVSALKKLNLDKLEETILLQAELLELRASKSTRPRGMVIESKIDKTKGVIATVLVQSGTLRIGDIVVAGTGFGKVKSMTDDKNRSRAEAIPSMPVEVIGFNTSPEAGDGFAVVEEEKKAREICDYRANKQKEHKIATKTKSSLEDLFAQTSQKQSSSKTLAIIIKGDVQGSVEAISSSLKKINGEEIKISILHAAVGGINESDVALAQASNAIILGFNVRANVSSRALAEKENINIMYYSIIYELVDHIKSVMSGMLAPARSEQYLGRVEIRQVFNVSKVGKVGGAFVVDGSVKRGAQVRLIRDNVVIHDGKLKTLKRFKDDVKEVSSGYECGIAFDNYDDIKEKDIIEAYEITEKQRTIK